MFAFCCDFLRCCLDKQISWFSSHLRALDAENAHRLPYILTGWKLRTSHRRLTLDSARKQNKSCIVWKTHSVPVGLEESSSLQSGDPLNEDEIVSEDSPEQLFAKPLSSDEVNLHELTFSCFIIIRKYTIEIEAILKSVLSGW